jgi:hypothetical protein
MSSRIIQEIIMKQTILLSIVLLLVGCAPETIYKGIPAVELSDEQLVEELASTLQGLGMAIERTQYLIAVRPEPAYVLTSSTSTFSGILNANYSAYTMPVGYGVSTHGNATGSIHGSSSTQYHYMDINAGERLGNSIATLISNAQVAAYRKRGQEVWAEFQYRVRTRRVQAERTIQEFFAAHPDLKSRGLLVTAVAPWAAAEGPRDGRQTLERTREIIENLSRGPGLSGTWYGILSQTTVTENGEKVAFNDFVRIDLTESEGILVGKGMLGSNDLLELNGKLSEQKVEGVVANITGGINVTFSGIAATNQITAEFKGSGAGQRLTGTVVLLR